MPLSPPPSTNKTFNWGWVQWLHEVYKRVSPPAVDNHVRAGNTQLYDGNASTSVFTASASLVEDTWETVGPTGSGAANIWDAMDVLPANATILIIECVIHATATSGTGDAYGIFYATEGDTTAAPKNAQTTEKHSVQFDFNNIGDIVSVGGEVLIPLEATNQDFQAAWSAFDATVVVSLYYRGFMTD